MRAPPLATALLAALATLATDARASTAEELVAEGNELLGRGDTDGAISRYGEAQSLQPNSAEVDLDLGLAHHRKGEHDRAAEYFTTAAGKGGGRRASVARFNLGNVRVKQGRLEDALEAYRAALEADPTDDDARVNYEIVERYLARLKKQEEKRKAAEEEFKKRLEELVKEVGEIVERQAEAVARTWKTDPGSEGPQLKQEDVQELKELGEQRQRIPDELGSKIARALVKSRQLEAEPVTEEDLAAVEKGLAGRARGAAETAATLAAAIRPPPVQQPPQPSPGGPQPGAEPGQAGAGAPAENPLVGKLERAGRALEEGGRRLDEAGGELGGPEGPFARAEPHEAAGLWRFVQALGELAQPPEQGQGSVPEELKEALKRMQELRARQALVVLDLWAKYPDARGDIPGPDEQKAFWEKVRAGETPSEDERLPVARLEIASSGAKGEARSANGLAETQSGLAEEARELATELEAIAAKAGGQSPVGTLVAMLRSAAEAMDGAAGALAASPAGAEEAEPAAVLAFVRLSRAPNEMDALLADLGKLLAEEMMLLLDTWKSDPASRGEVPTDEELEAAKDEIERAAKGEGDLSPGLEAKLGRMVVSAVERAAIRRAAGKVGAARKGEEAAGLQEELAARAERLAEDMRNLAGSGRRGEANPAAPVLDAAAKDVDHAAGRMRAAAGSLPSDFKTAEPEEARAVAALMRALSKFAQGAAGSAGQEDQREQQGEQKQQEEREGEEKEDERKQGQEPEPQEEKKPDEEKESVSKQQAERLLDEAAQEEREVRRDIRKRRGSRAVEVRRDW